MNHLGCLIGVSLVSLEMQMVSVKGYDCLRPRPLVFPRRHGARVAPRPHNRISVSAPNGDGERRRIFLLLIKDGEKANRRKEGVSFMHCGGQDFHDPHPHPLLLIPAVGSAVTALISQVLRWLQIRSQQRGDVPLTNAYPLSGARSTPRLILFPRRLSFPTSC